MPTLGGLQMSQQALEEALEKGMGQNGQNGQNGQLQVQHGACTSAVHMAVPSPPCMAQHCYVVAVCSRCGRPLFGLHLAVRITHCLALLAGCMGLGVL